MKRSAGFKVLGMMGAGLALAGTGVAPLAALADVDASSVQVIEREAIEYDKIPNVTGGFSFCQDALTPGDDVFNLFGTATTTVCAKPGFAFDQVSHESYYLNIGGEVQKVYTVGLDQIEQMESEMQEMRCTCGMSFLTSRSERVPNIFVMSPILQTDLSSWITLDYLDYSTIEGKRQAQPRF